MTNSLFRDLTREGTIKGFLNAGINPYNSDGSFKSVIQLMTELADVFSSQQTQLQVNNLKNAFSGSEGLTAMLNAAAGGAEQLTAQLRNFDNAELNLNRTREIALGDLTLLEEEMRNKFNTSLTQLGEALLPARIEFTRLAIKALDFVREIADWQGTARRTGAQNANWAQEQFVRYGEMSISEKEQFLADVRTQRDAGQARYQAIPTSGIQRGVANSFIVSSVVGWGSRAREENRLSTLSEVGIYNDILAQAEAWGTASGIVGRDGDSKTNADAQSAISTAIGGGRQQKVINVTIGSLVGSQSFNSTVRESRDDITSIVEEALIRAIYGAEQMAAR